MKAQYSAPTSHSKTRKGVRPNDSKKPPVIGSGKNKPCKYYNMATKTWHQPKE